VNTRRISLALVAAAICLTTLAAPTQASAASGENLVPDPGLRRCIASEMAWAGVGPAWDDPSFAVSITQQDFDNLRPRMGSGGFACHDTGDLEGMQYLRPDLEKIYLYGVSTASLAPLAVFTGTTELILHGEGSPDTAGLAGMSSLRYLTLELTGPKPVDLSPLAALPDLGGVTLLGAAFADVSPLAYTNFWYLHLEDTAVSDVSALSTLTGHGMMLFLPRNRIVDIAPLTSMTRVTYLDVRGNLIEDLSPLVDMPQLDTIYLDDNLVSDVSPLAQLPNLALLSIANNLIEDASPLARHPRLYLLDLDGNQVADLATGGWTAHQFSDRWRMTAFDQRLSATARVDTAFPLPSVVGPEYDVVSWQLLDGDATWLDDNTLELGPEPGTVTLSFAAAATHFSGTLTITVEKPRGPEPPEPPAPPEPPSPQVEPGVVPVVHTGGAVAASPAGAVVTTVAGVVMVIGLALGRRAGALPAR